MSIDDATASRAKLLAAVEAIALARQDGALLLVEAESTSLKRLRAAGASDADLTTILLHAFQLASDALPDAASARTAWNRCELAVPGARATVITAATTLVAGLTAHPTCGSLRWRAILTRVFPGEALRTHHCDPGYDLAHLTSSCVVWVDPYPGDDWRQSQRYPTTTVVWQAG
jgi:hypothetical protein